MSRARAPHAGFDTLGLERVGAPSTSLLDAVDRLIDKGVVLRGDALISIADVDLIRLDLNLLLAAVETLDQAARRRAASATPRAGRDADFADHAAYADSTSESVESVVGPSPATSRAAVNADYARSQTPANADWASPRTPGKADSAPSQRVVNADCTPSRAPTNAPPTTTSPPPAGPRIELDPKNAEKGVARLVLTLVEFVRRLLERQAIRRMEGGLLPDEAIERMGETLARLEGKVDEMKRIFGLAGEELDIDLGPLGRLNGPIEGGGPGGTRAG